MSTDTKTTQTIDARIRENARRDLENEIEDLVAPLDARLMQIRFNNTGVLHPDGNCWTEGNPSLSFRQMVDVLKTQIIRALTPLVEEKAVAEFLVKVDGLQAQLDELQGEIENRG